MISSDQRSALPSGEGAAGDTQQPRKPVPGYKPEPDDQKLIRRVQERINWATRDGARWALERQIFEIIAFMCLDEATPVLRADCTETPIGALRVGDRLLAPDEHGASQREVKNGAVLRHWRVAEVEAIRRATKRCLRVEFESGRVLLITPDHRVLMEPGDGSYPRTREWREIGELSVGSLVVVGYGQSPSLPAEDLGWLGGFLDGEGTLRGIGTRGGEIPSMGAGALAFSQKPGAVLDKANDLFRRLNVGVSEQWPTGKVYERGPLSAVIGYLNGGAQTAIRVLRQVPSVRLRQALQKVVEAGAVTAMPLRTERIVSMEDAGERTVVDIQTTTGTFVANGYVVHNCGIQWIEYSEVTRRFSRWNAPSWFPTPVDNQFTPRVNLIIASLLKSNPQGRVRPNTNDPADREAAKVAEAMVGHIYDVTREEELRQQAAVIAATNGTVIAEDVWDPTAGRILRIPRGQVVDQPAMTPAAVCPTCDPPPPPEDPQLVGYPCPTCQTPMVPGEQPRMMPDGTPATMPQFQPETDETGQPIVDEVPEGEIVSRVRQLFNFYWDPKATCLREARWCGEAIYVDLNWIDEHFPDMGPFVGQEAGIEGQSFYEASLLSLVGPSIQGTAFYGGTHHLQNGAVLRKYQERKSREYPQGLYLIVANGVLLYKGALPIKDEDENVVDEFSYTEFKYDIVPGRFPGRTPAEDMVPSQRSINAIRAHMVLNRKTLLSPWILAPKGSGLNPGQVAMRPGAVVLYNSIGVANSPQVVQGTPLPDQIWKEYEAAIASMDRAIHDATAAATSEMQAAPGIAMHFMKETLDEMALPRLKRYGQWIAERDRKRLLLAQQYYQEPRAVKLLGLGSDYQVRHWKGADLRGNVDISVDPGSLIPRAKSMKTQIMLDLLDKGVIDPTNQMQRQRLLDNLDMPEFDTEIGPDLRRAKKENAAMDDGERASVNDFDNHEVHLSEHNARVKDPSFDALPDVSKRLHLQHIQAHQQAQLQSQQQDLTQQLDQARQQSQLEAQAKAAGKGLIAPDLPPVGGGGTPPSIDTSGAGPQTPLQ